MRAISVLITGAGAPGILGTIYSLKNNFEKREIKIIGTDIKDGVIGKFVCDSFFTIPPAKDREDYLNALLKICYSERVDVLIPQNTSELEILSLSKKVFEDAGTKIVVSDYESIDNANNKFFLMQKCKEFDIPVGDFYLISNERMLFEKAKLLGWPQKKIVVKPPVSNGLRGVRIIDEEFNPTEAFYSEKPNNLVTNMESLVKILGEEYPELIITEYLPGKEFTVDLFRNKKDILIIPRVRKLIRSGITFNGKVINHEEIITYSKVLSEKLDLSYCFGFQFKLDENNTPKILESNPRVQGTMVLATLANANVIYLSIKALLNEKYELPQVKWGTELLRYWGGVAISENSVIDKI